MSGVKEGCVDSKIVVTAKFKRGQMMDWFIDNDKFPDETRAVFEKYHCVADCGNQQHLKIMRDFLSANQDCAVETATKPIDEEVLIVFLTAFPIYSNEWVPRFASIN
jgi:hypothetical protein